MRGKIVSKVKNIHILQLVNTLDVGGATGNALDIAQKLSENDDFSIFFAAGAGYEWLERAENISRKVFLLDDMKPTHRNDISRSFFGDFKTIYQIARILRDNEIDIIHCHGSKTRLLGGLAAVLVRKPIRIQTAHGFSFSSYTPLIKKYILWLVEVLMGRILFQKTIVVSDFDLKKAVSLKIGTYSSTQRIYYGIDTNLYSPIGNKKNIRQKLNLPIDIPIVSMVGRLSEQKDPITFVKVAKYILDMGYEVQFLLVGDGPLYHLVQEEIGDFSSQIRLLGNRSDVKNILRASDIFVLTSKWEGLPISILEAQSTGLPILATKIDGTPEAVIDEKTGYCVDVGDIEGFVKHIKQLLENPMMATQIGNQGRQQILNRHTTEVMTSQVVDLYFKLYDEQP